MGSGVNLPKAGFGPVLNPVRREVARPPEKNEAGFNPPRGRV